MENSNPTIINPSDLPTRRRAPLTHKSTTAGQSTSSVLFSTEPSISSHLLDPFSPQAHQRESDSDSERDSLHNISPDDSVRAIHNEDEEPIDDQEIFDLISSISDPEHPISLGSLAVVSLPDIEITSPKTARPTRVRTVTVLITPTITHCSLATVIGLGVRVRLEQSLPPQYRVDVRIKKGTHSTADEVNKQLADKERVAAALENATLMGVIGKMLETCQ